jgi:cytidine deaminase
MIESNELIEHARRAAAAALAKYSGFRVGAAILCEDGSVFTGFNIENRSFSLTVCAERTALFCALVNGKTRFKELAIVGLDSEAPLPPCGACRQVLTEFLLPETSVHFAGSAGEIQSVTLGELLPYDSLHDLKFT